MVDTLVQRNMDEQLSHVAGEDNELVENHVDARGIEGWVEPQQVTMIVDVAHSSPYFARNAITDQIALRIVRVLDDA